MKENLIEPNDTLHPSIGNGITIRQYYAGLAMQGMLANSYSNGSTQPLSELRDSDVANLAVAYADALINELNKTNKP